jgi:hypothetical protein
MCPVMIRQSCMKEAACDRIMQEHQSCMKEAACDGIMQEHPRSYISQGVDLCVAATPVQPVHVCAHGSMCMQVPTAQMLCSLCISLMQPETPYEWSSSSRGVYLG